MNLSDEMLSAFLDGELSEKDMDSVRSALAADISIADRLAALAEVDMVVKAAAEKATATALPQSIVELLSAPSEKPITREAKTAPSVEMESQINEVKQSALVTTLRQKRANAKPTKRTMPLAVAASVVFLAGLVFFQLGKVNQSVLQGSHWANVSQALDNNLTGETARFASEVSVTPQLSFINTELQYCRQAEVISNEELNVMIACKDASIGWQLVASKLGASEGEDALYQTASSARLLENELNSLMATAPLTRKQERNAVKENWYTQETNKGVNDEN